MADGSLFQEGQTIVAIFNTSNKKRQTFGAENVPDWRTHTGIAAHRTRLEARRAQMPALEAACVEASHELAQAEQSLQHIQTLDLAGRLADAGALTQATQTRDAAAQALAVAKVKHAECVRDVDLLERGLPIIVEQVRQETAAQMLETYSALMASFKAKIDAAVEVNEQLHALYLQMREQFPDGTFTDGWPLALGVLPPSWPDLRRARNSDGVHLTSRYETFGEEYARWRAERNERASPHDPIRSAQQDDVVIDDAPSPPPAGGVSDLVRIPGLPSLESVMQRLGLHA